MVTTNITLANDWTRYELSLNGTDLTNIEYPFGFIVERGRNNSALEQPDGDNPPLNNPSTSQITLYLKGITFDTDPAESPLNATTTGQALNATTTGQALNATTTGQALNATTTGQALNATTTGQALNATTTGQALNATTTGQALNATTTGQALNATTTGQALNATTTGQALNARPSQLTNDTSIDTVWSPTGPITQNNLDNQSQLSAEDNLFKAEITESSNGTSTADRTLDPVMDNSNGRASNERSNIAELPVNLNDFADPNMSADAIMENSNILSRNP